MICDPFSIWEINLFASEEQRTQKMPTASSFQDTVFWHVLGSRSQSICSSDQWFGRICIGILTLLQAEGWEEWVHIVDCLSWFFYIYIVSLNKVHIQEELKIQEELPFNQVFMIETVLKLCSNTCASHSHLASLHGESKSLCIVLWIQDRCESSW